MDDEVKDKTLTLTMGGGAPKPEAKTIEELQDELALTKSKLKTQGERAGDQEKILAQANERITFLTKRLEEATNEVRSVKGGLSADRENVLQWKAQRDAAKIEMEHLESQVKPLKNEIAGLQSKLNTRDKQLKERDAEIARLERGVRDGQAMQNARDKAQRERGEAQAAAAEWQGTAEAREARLKLLLQTNADLSTAVEAFKVARIGWIHHDMAPKILRALHVLVGAPPCKHQYVDPGISPAGEHCSGCGEPKPEPVKSPVKKG